MSKAIKNTGKWIIRILFFFLLVLLFILTLLYLPPFQSLISEKSESYLQKKLETKIMIGAIRFNLKGNLILKNIYLEDNEKDTLLNAERIQISLSLPRLLQKELFFKKISLSGIHSKLNFDRQNNYSNFQFIIEKFKKEQPDKTSEKKDPWTIGVNSISLADIRFLLDLSDQMSINVKAGEIKLLARDIDLEALVFSSDRLGIMDTDINLIIKNTDTSKEIELSSKLISLQTSQTYFSLKDKLIRSKEIRLLEGTTRLILPDSITHNNDKASTNEKEAIYPLKNFGWELVADNIDIRQYNFILKNGNQNKLPQRFNPDNIKISDLQFNASALKMNSDIFSVGIKKLNFSEHSGIMFHNFSGNIRYDDDSISLGNLFLSVNQSEFKGDISFGNDPFNRMAMDPGNIKTDIMIKVLDLFSDDLRHFSFYQFLRVKNIRRIRAETSISGFLDSLSINHLKVELNDMTRLNSHGEIKNIMDPENINGSFCIHSLITEKNMLISQISTDTSRNNVIKWIPENISLQGKIQGRRDEFSADLDLQTSIGDLSIASTYRGDSYHKSDTLKALLELRNYNPADTTLIPDLSKLDLDANVELVLDSINTPQVNLKIHVVNLLYNNHSFNNIKSELNYAPDHITGILESQDPGLELRANIDVKQVDSTYFIKGRIRNSGVDLYTLGLSEDSLRIKSDISLNGFLAKNSIEGKIHGSGTEFISDKKYSIDTIALDFLRSTDTSRFYLETDMVSLTYNSSFPLKEIKDRLKNQFLYYINKNPAKDISGDPGQFDVEIKFKKPIEGLGNLSPYLNYINISNISSRLDESSHYFTVSASIQKYKSDKFELDSAEIVIDGKNQNLRYNIDIKKAESGNFFVKNLILNGITKNDTLSNKIELRDSLNHPQYITGLDIYKAVNEDVIFLLNPDEFIFNYNSWNVDPYSHVALSNNNKLSGEINLSRKDQTIGFQIKQDTSYFLNIKNFRLAGLKDLMLNSDSETDLSGVLDMSSVIYFTNEIKGVETDVSIRDLYYKETRLGNINASVSTQDNSIVPVDLTLTNEENTIQLKGTYFLDDDSSPVDMKMTVSVQDLSRFESFANGEINKLSGKITADLDLKGNISTLKTKGNISLTDMGFFVNAINSDYYIENETVVFMDDVLQLDDFIVRDEQQNEIVVAGKIFFLPGYVPDFDLHLTSDNFLGYNATEKENPGLNGQLYLTADAHILGNITKPEIVVDLTIEKDTKINYVLPAKEINLVSDEGIVEFINPDQSDSLTLEAELTQRDTLLNQFKGISLSSNLRVNREAQFTVEIDPRSGDYITIQGSGDLSLDLSENTDPVLSGIFEVYKGEYQVSFYGLVKKTFDFQEGSRIQWTGDPYNANLKLSAAYTIRTASNGLLSRELAGLPAEESKNYQRPLPYEVKILMNGTMKSPDINFEINLLEENLAAYPMVTAKLNRLNEEGNESELSQQVFGLLTLGSFIPERTAGGGPGSYGAAFATTAAANSLNGILTNELNNLSDKYLKGFNVDIGMQSFSDVNTGSSDTRTTMDVKVSKNLFNERVTLEAQTSFNVGGDRYTDPTGYYYSNYQNDFAIIYDITKNGDYKLKVFDKSSFDIIYKDIRTTGVALIFIREFDKIKEKKSDSN